MASALLRIAELEDRSAPAGLLPESGVAPSPALPPADPMDLPPPVQPNPAPAPTPTATSGTAAPATATLGVRVNAPLLTTLFS